ncbi:hypothetical protein [Nostoc sp. NMS7]|nr:hypothetical protein [Nostoc sp. NMS7]
MPIFRAAVEVGEEISIEEVRSHQRHTQNFTCWQKTRLRLSATVT